MKKALILFAKGFPYNVSEPFLENEYPLYKEYFDKVLIVTGCGRKEKATRNVIDPTIEIITDFTLSKDIFSILRAIPFVLKDNNFYKECHMLMKKRKFSISNFYTLLVVAICGNHRAYLAWKWLKKNPEYNISVIYSYWLQITAYATLKLNSKLSNKCYTISRAHRFDLYEERQRGNYIPFQEQLYNELDEIASISEDGKRYLENKYGNRGKVSICHLGALDRKILNPYAEREEIHIVSCARAVPVKRLEKIVDVLKLINNKKVFWTHIGGGPLLEQLKETAEKLPENIKVNFTGTIPNTQVYQIYEKQPFHIFLNVSKSEGVSVSIMEAMSFGIPVIATAVGGTGEMIDAGENGFLLKEEYKDGELMEYIKRIIEMDEDAYCRLRRNARAKFEREYNAIPNYRKFVEKLAQR